MWDGHISLPSFHLTHLRQSSPPRLFSPLPTKAFFIIPFFFRLRNCVGLDHRYINPNPGQIALLCTTTPHKTRASQNRTPTNPSQTNHHHYSTQSAQERIDADALSNYQFDHIRRRLEQMWIEVTVDTQVDVLIDSVKQGFRSKEFDSAAGLSRTMVFANTVEAVEAVSKILATSGNECFRYHSYTSLEERTQILVDFQQKGGILVCTDAAAHGLDVMNVSHVIQIRGKLVS